MRSTMSRGVQNFLAGYASVMALMPSLETRRSRSAPFRRLGQRSDWLMIGKDFARASRALEATLSADERQRLESARSESAGLHVR
jgi:hypothetical protein